MDEISPKRQKDLLAGLLRQIRESTGIHQAELARKLGKPQSFVSRYEMGERRLDLIELRQVCQAMGMSLSDFIKQFEGKL